jgi:hypothetical protein
VTGGCAAVPRYGVTSYFTAAGAPALVDAFQVTVAFSLPTVTLVIVGAPGPAADVFGAAGFVVGVVGVVVGVEGGADCAPADVASSTTRSPAHTAPAMAPRE